MTSYLQLTDVTAPLAQTFRITEPSGVVLTGIGLYFYSKPGASDPDLPVSIELRPVTEGGNPSSVETYSGTRVDKVKADITASTTFNASTGETKFTFPEPFYVPPNIELALTVYTNSKPGDYQIWIAEMGEFVSGSTSQRITTQPNVGSFFTSSNGTTWTPEQNKDIAFKIYQAKFNSVNSVAYLAADTPPENKLAYIDALENPFKFTAASNKVKVLHGAHGFLVNDTVRITGLDSATEYAGVLGSSILGKRTILEKDPYGYVFQMDSAADSSVRSGGLNAITSDQYMIDTMKLTIPNQQPQLTNISTKGFFTTGNSHAGAFTAYQSVNNVDITPFNWYQPDRPFVLASEHQESDRLSSLPSTFFEAVMHTDNVNVAPYININNSSLEIGNNLIDFADSNGRFAGAGGYDSSGSDGRNKLAVTTYVPEQNPTNGTATAKHITVPIYLAEDATSIRVFVDAMKPAAAQFDVWFRTGKQDEFNDPLWNKNWQRFSLEPDVSNYRSVAPSSTLSEFSEYRFQAEGLPEFDSYQFKIVMYSVNSARPPIFKNFRTIATV